jgi:hypothetical protein
MRKHKLINILKTFTSDEMKNFGLFITSPYFNRKRNFKPFYTILKKYHPDYPDEEFTGEKLYKRMYPNMKFDKKKASLNIRVLYSQMANFALKFLAYERLKQDDSFLINLAGVASLSNKQFIDLALKTHEINSAALDTGVKGPEYYHNRFTANTVFTDLLMLHDKNSDPFKHERNNLLYLYAYMFNNLAGYLNDASISRVNKNAKTNGVELAKSLIKAFNPESFESECEADKFETINITIFNYYIIKSWLDLNDRDSVFKALEYFYKLFHRSPPIFQFISLERLFNLLMRHRRIDRIYSVKINEVIDFAWGKGVYGADKYGFLEVHPFLNVLIIKLFLLSTSDVKKYIDIYIEKLEPKYRKDVLNFSMAYICFKERQFGNCLEFLIKKDDFEPLIRKDKYKLKICSLFEQGFYEESKYAAESFEQYLKRNKKELGPGFHIQIRFLKAFKYISALKFQNKKANVVYPPEAFDLSPFTIDGSWIIEKINELNKRV